MNDIYYQAVYRYVQQVPPGQVTTYGAIGQVVGLHPRQVGYILHRNPSAKITPCHRVVRSNGQLASGYAYGGPDQQQALLQSEGVPMSNHRIGFTRYPHVLYNKPA